MSTVNFFDFDPNSYSIDWGEKEADVKTGLGKYKKRRDQVVITLKVSGYKDFNGSPDDRYCLYCYNCCGQLSHVHKLEVKYSTEKINTLSNSAKKKGELELSAEVEESIKILSGKQGVKAKGSIEKGETISSTSKESTENTVPLEFDGHAKYCKTILVPIGPIVTVIVSGTVDISRTYDLADSSFWTSEATISYNITISSISRLGTLPTLEGDNTCDPCKKAGKEGGLIIESNPPATGKEEGAKEKQEKPSGE